MSRILLEKAGSHSTKTVSNSASEIVAAGSAGNPRRIVLTCTSQSVRFQVMESSTSDPTSSVGHLLNSAASNPTFELYTDKAVKAIRTGGSDATVEVSVYPLEIY